jgi:uncharacterized protein
MSNLIKRHQQEINKICEESGISYLALFGSQARNEASPDSDVDLLVEFRKVPGLIKFIQIKHQFEKTLDRKVDLVTKKGLSKFLTPFVSQDLQQIYG